VRRPVRFAAAALIGVVAGSSLVGCDAINSVARPSQALVLTGAQVPALVGAAPEAVVAFRHTLVGDDPVWVQIPVQVDQRKVVGFGTQPANNTTAGVTGTVYGSGSAGPTALQYADPNTFVGADTDPNVDADDEIVFMVADGGGKARPDDRSSPAGVVAGSGVAVQFDDPLGADQRGWVYLFRSAGGLDPAAGQDYVDYDFTLTSGSYKTTYKRADGPNPETSRVITPSYRIDFTDRWFETSWKVLVAGASGADVLDGHKNQFALSTCGRSNATFADAEGAFVANIDGPVRAIRSYVGANSGPRTQRTHLMYRDHEQVLTDLRVHEIPGIMDYIDYSEEAVGMTYRSSTTPAGVRIDGAADVVSTDVPTWEAVSGSQGMVLSHNEFTSSAPGLEAGTRQFYRDAAFPTEQQCWGDGYFLGASGAHIQTTIPDTDPTSAGFATLQGRRSTWFGAAPADSSAIGVAAADWAAEQTTPLVATVSAYQP
jgi:hypothetical protein